MTATERTIFLLTYFDEEGGEKERLVEAPTRAAAVKHALQVNKAGAADVARVLGANGTVEKAAE